MAVIGRLAALLALLAVGIGGQWFGVLRSPWSDRLNAVAFYVALPAVVFLSTYDQSLSDLVSPALLAGLWAVLFGTVALAWLVHRNRESDARRSVAVVQSYHGNLGYLGLPLVVATFGDAAGAVASVVLGVLALVQVPLTILLLVRFNDAEASVRNELRSLAVNPVLLSLLAGLAVSVANVGVPDPALTALEPLSALALPLALILVGASLELDLPAVDLPATGSVVAVKVVVMPALAAVVFSVLDVSRTAFVAAVVMLAMPTAVSTYVYATELGGDPEFASLNVFATTVSAMATLFVVLQVVGPA